MSFYICDKKYKWQFHINLHNLKPKTFMFIMSIWVLNISYLSEGVPSPLCVLDPLLQLLFGLSLQSPDAFEGEARPLLDPQPDFLVEGQQHFTFTVLVHYHSYKMGC